MGLGLRRPDGDEIAARPELAYRLNLFFRKTVHFKKFTHIVIASIGKRGSKTLTKTEQKSRVLRKFFGFTASCLIATII
jgi:hypothetical protein